MSVDVRTSEEFRLIQVFLSAEGRGVFETYVSTVENEMACTCPGFYYRRFCKHTEFISNTIKTTPGNTYNVTITDDGDMDAMPSFDAPALDFRRWMLDSARVIVL